jgi:hypothetical protein
LGNFKITLFQNHFCWSSFLHLMKNMVGVKQKE